jgi:hypothetical protein
MKGLIPIPRAHYTKGYHPLSYSYRIKVLTYLFPPLPIPEIWLNLQPPTSNLHHEIHLDITISKWTKMMMLSYMENLLHHLLLRQK